jgi:hypothetical protein
MNNEQDIDKLFRRSLTDPVNETGYREDDWAALETMLHKGKKRPGIVLWLPIISSVAAMLLLFFGWWIFKSQDTVIPKKPQQITSVQPAKSAQSIAHNNPVPPIINTPLVIKPTVIAHPATIRSSNYGERLVTKTTGSIEKTGPNNSYKPDELPTPDSHVVNTDPDNLVAINTGIASNATNNHSEVVARDITNYDYAKSRAVKRSQEITRSSFKHPQFALSVFGAPEINGVNSFQQSKTGSNIGLVFSVGINKLTVSTGAYYSTKPYNTSFDNFRANYSLRSSAVSVTADCRVIDIPLNIDYQVYNKSANKLSIGTGISSYLMMHESYQYNYNDTYARPPRTYNISSPGNYFFGVLNLQATYQRKINAKVGVSIQPYMKVPLSNIGSSAVKLQSAGVALGLSWNINLLTKP